MFALGTIRLPMAVSFFVKNVFEKFYREDWVTRYIQNLPVFLPLSVIFSNMVMWFIIFTPL